MEWPFLGETVPYGIAHQGGDDVAPGNTEASFANAVALGYTHIETDVQATSDGVLVVFHDEDLEPSTGVRGRIEDLTWAEVSELRVGDDHPLARFDEMVERFPETRFNIEPKADTAVEPLIELIERLDLADRIGIGSFDDTRVDRVARAVGPGLATSPGPVGLVRVLLTAILRPGGSVSYSMVQIPTRYWILPLATRWLIGRYHRLGLQVHVWTINDEQEMNDLLDRGVDAIMTDRTELLRTVLRERGHWPESD